MTDILRHDKTNAEIEALWEGDKPLTVRVAMKQPPEGYEFVCIGTSDTGEAEAQFEHKTHRSHWWAVPLPHHIGQRVTLAEEWKQFYFESGEVSHAEIFTTDCSFAFLKENVKLLADSFRRPAATMPEVRAPHCRYHGEIKSVDVVKDADGVWWCEVTLDLSSPSPQESRSE